MTDPQPAPATKTPRRELVLTPLNLVKSSKRKTLDAAGLLPVGAPVVFSGRAGTGKSTYSLDVAARVTTGTLDGDYMGTPRNVLYVSHEDDAGEEVKPRITAAGGNLENFIMVKIRITVGNDSTDEVPDIEKDLGLLRKAIEDTNAALVIIDPLISTMRGDSHKQDDVRRLFNPLAAMARETGIALICIMHSKKGHSASADMTSGSHAFRDIARSLLQFAIDGDSGRVIVTVDKSSYSSNQGLSFAFEFVPVDVPTDDGEVTKTTRVNWLGKSDVSVDDCRAQEAPSGDRDGFDAKAFLIEYLRERGGSAPAKEVFAAGKEYGFQEHSLRRAGVHVQQKSGFQAPSVWGLKPEFSAKDDNDDSGDTTVTTVTIDPKLSSLGDVIPLLPSSPKSADSRTSDEAEMMSLTAGGNPWAV